jgi:hypothetical protein
MKTVNLTVRITLLVPKGVSPSSLCLNTPVEAIDIMSTEGSAIGVKVVDYETESAEEIEE